MHTESWVVVLQLRMLPVVAEHFVGLWLSSRTPSRHAVRCLTNDRLCPTAADVAVCCVYLQGLGDEPVWRQKLQYYLFDHSNPAAARQAAAALLSER